ncbi:MAG: serine protease [Candidatus Aenigmarchaeota archaeon]|nr:serine protease [Candidatus Aenigmarchaeota archaeon]
MIKSLLPEDWHKIIISVEKHDKINDIYFPIGTGFLIGYKGFTVFVTAKHIAEIMDKNEDIYLAWNANDSSIIRKNFENLKNDSEWIFHENSQIDIAVRFFKLYSESDDVRVLAENLFESFEDVMEGDDILFLGFPLHISEPNKIHPVVRSGIIAYRKENKNFLIDANVFPGSSGSPVFLKTSAITYEKGNFNLGKVRIPKLVGIIIEALLYDDIAISQQTKRHVVTFSENAGFGVVLSVDLINDILESQNFQMLFEKIKKIDAEINKDK